MVSRYSRSVTESLVHGAIGAYERAGGREADLVVLDAPGAFELPVLVAGAIGTGKFDGVVALGCIIRGETKHDRVLGHAVAQALAQISAREVVPVGLGVLTVENVDQAVARAGGDKGNKGAEAMEAVLMTIDSLAKVRGGRGQRGAQGAHAARPDKARSALAGRRA